jgi:hypothetical protein
MKLTDPDIATKPAIVEPVAIPVGENSASVGNLPPMRIPAPPVAAERFPLPDRVRQHLGGDDMPGIDMTGAPSSDPRYDPTAREYVPPGSNLPMQVSQAELLRSNQGRGNNVWPADSEASAPALAGTKVVGSLDALRRRAGGQ